MGKKPLEQFHIHTVRDLAKEVGLKVSKKDTDGKWRPKNKDELIFDLRSAYPAHLYPSKSIDEYNDIMLALRRNSPPAQIAQIIKSSPQLIPRTAFYRTDPMIGSISGLGEAPPYDLSEISRAADVEPYLVRAITRHREQILKDGYSIRSRDTDLKRYIDSRLFEISLRSPMPVEHTFRESITNLIKYHTAFIVIERDVFRSSGRPIKLYGKVLEPISAIYPVDPLTMRPVLSKKRNRVLRWNHVIDTGFTAEANSTGIIGTWPDVDVITITVDKKSGFLFGTPFILPVLDDLRALRRLEELVGIITAKHAFPLLHWKVGTDDAPVSNYEDGTSELDDIRAQAEYLGSTGMAVTTHRHEINLVGAEGEAMDLEKYLKYFESRAMGGLRLSEIDLGKGNAASKASARTISKSIEDASLDYQKVFSEAISWKLLMYLALEGEFNVNYDNMAVLHFPPIDTEEQRAKETHAMLQFQSNALDHDEMRRDADREPMTEEQMRKTQFKMFDLPSVEHEQQQKTKASVQNKAQPRNQSGTKSTKTRVTMNNSAFTSKASSYIQKLKAIANTDAEDFPWEDALNATGQELMTILRSTVMLYGRRGINDALESLGESGVDVSNDIFRVIVEDYCNNLLRKYIESTYIRIQDQLQSKRVNLIATLHALQINLNSLERNSKRMAYKLGFIKTALTFEKAEVIAECDKCSQIDLVKAVDNPRILADCDCVLMAGYPDE